MAGEQLVEAIMAAALGAVDNKGMADLLFGEVASVDPLKVKVDNRFELKKDFLIVPRNLTDYTVTVSMSEKTEVDLIKNLVHSHSTPVGDSGTDLNADLDHTHEYKGSKTYTIHNALKAGDRVALLRAIGGQKFYILDKVVGG